MGIILPNWLSYFSRWLNQKPDVDSWHRVLLILMSCRCKVTSAPCGRRLQGPSIIEIAPATKQKNCVEWWHLSVTVTWSYMLQFLAAAFSTSWKTCFTALLPGEDAHAFRRGSQLPGYAALERCRSAEVGGLEQVTWQVSLVGMEDSPRKWRQDMLLPSFTHVLAMLYNVLWCFMYLTNIVFYIVLLTHARCLQIVFPCFANMKKSPAATGDLRRLENMGMTSTWGM
jgi:hypothetical protein